MNFKTYTFNTLDFENNCNILKDCIINQLCADGHLNQKVAEDWCMNVSIVIKEPRFFNRMWNKLCNKPDQDHFIIVRNMNLAVDQNPGNDDESKAKGSGRVLSLIKKDEPRSS